MRKLVTMFTISVFVVTLSCSQTTDQKQGDKNTPKIEFTNTEHDYGTIEQGADGTCEFVFTNTGMESLVISDVHSSCGCTVPSYSKEPIKKGDKGTITVKYDTRRLGPINKSITVTTNAVNSPVTLRIKGNIVPKQEKQQTE